MPAKPLRRISPNPPARRYHWETRQVVDVLRELVQVGDVMTYAMIKELCGIDLQQRRHLIGSVKRCALEEYNIVLDPLPGVGYERLSEPGKVARIDADTHRLHRATTRIQAIQKAVDMTELTPLEQHQYLCQQTLLGCLHLWTDPQVRRALPVAPETALLPVPFDVAAHQNLFTRKTP
jgi:hypothetical protein